MKIDDAVKFMDEGHICTVKCYPDYQFRVKDGILSCQTAGKGWMPTKITIKMLLSEWLLLTAPALKESLVFGMKARTDISYYPEDKVHNFIKDIKDFIKELTPERIQEFSVDTKSVLLNEIDALSGIEDKEDLINIKNRYKIKIMCDSCGKEKECRLTEKYQDHYYICKDCDKKRGEK